MQTMPFRMQYRPDVSGGVRKRFFGRLAKCRIQETPQAAPCGIFCMGDNMIRLMVNENSSPKVPPFCGCLFVAGLEPQKQKKSAQLKALRTFLDFCEL